MTILSSTQNATSLFFPFLRLKNILNLRNYLWIHSFMKRNLLEGCDVASKAPVWSFLSWRLTLEFEVI